MADYDSEQETIADQRHGVDPTQGGPTATEVEQVGTNRVGSEEWLLQQARAMHRQASDYLDANISQTWERSISHFQNEHAPGSPFAAKSYKRSRVFRPKTRSNIKAAESKLLVAMFGSRDLIVVEPENQRDPAQVASAKVNKYILQHRLSERMPWPLTALGAYQDTKVYGVCFSHNYWKYVVDESIVPARNTDGSPVMGKDDDGNPVPMGRKDRVVRFDDLCCDLIEPENMLFDPMCDWRDPINTSPYLVYKMPIYAGEALERMQNKNPRTGEPWWTPHSLAEILATRRDGFNRTRQAREGNRRVDPAEQNDGNEFTVVWAHMNIQKVNGEDYYWWTMGTEIVLTPMKRLIEDYPHLRRDERPFTMGMSTLEAHRNYPASDAEQGAGLQEELNLVANQRMDNVKLVLNKRYFVRRGSQTDLDALMRNVSGGGVMMNDPEKDVKVVDTRDVTGSSYQEQDRLSVEMDELVGSFSQSTVQSNRNLNETKHGMESMGSTAGMMSDYGMSLFIMTWVKPTLSQFVRLIQMYETDETILALAASEAEVFQRFGKGIDDELLRKQLTINVDVGMGNTDPLKRIERLTYGVERAMSLPGMAARIKSEDIANEIWAALGYRDGSRFFRNTEEQREYEQANPQQPPLEHQAKMEELRIREEDNRMRDERERSRMEQERSAKTGEQQQKAADQEATAAEQRKLEERRIQAARELKAADIAEKQRQDILSQVRGGRMAA